MSCLNRLVGLCPALALLFAGCALNAVKPPTPATYLNVDRNEVPPPDEHYYILVWAAQRVPRTPAYSHTFVTFVHTAEPEPGQVKILDAHTISWLPATLDIRPVAHHPEPGVNLTLKESLEYTRRNGERVSLWGPFECRASSYKRFLVQKDFLEVSGIGYQCVDNWGEAAHTGDGCNCIHAIADADPEYGRANYPLIWFGDSASEHLAHRLRERGSILNPDVEHDEILAALGLCDYPIRRRHFDDRLIDFPRVQPGETIFGWLRRAEPRQAPPYDVPPFPPPGRHCP
jgi:hypothetical protein